jgi:O-antigen/teichoic acid export membrane protein
MAMAIKSLKVFFLGTLLRKNVLANYIGLISSIIGSLISLPFYLSILGLSQYGLIAVILLIQILLNSLDFGLWQSMIREISIALKLPDGRLKTSSLVFNVEKLYWVLALVITFIVIVISTYISTHWLNLLNTPIEIAKLSVCGAALIFLFQFPGIFYRSVLIAAEEQIYLNKILTVTNIFRHIVGVILVFLYPSIVTYIIWQILIVLCETFIRRAKVYSIFGNIDYVRYWDFNKIINFFRLTSGLSFALWAGTFFTQIDKIIMSKIVSINEFAYYSIATTISLGVLQLIQPIIMSAQPTAFALKDDPFLLHQLYKKLFLYITLIFSLIILGFFLLGRSLLELWLGNANLTNHVFDYCSLLLIGSAFNALYSIGYMDWIVHKKTKNLLALNLASLAIVIVFLPVVINTFSSKNAPLVWIIINFLCFSCTLGWLKKVTRS